MNKSVTKTNKYRFLWDNITNKGEPDKTQRKVSINKILKKALS